MEEKGADMQLDRLVIPANTKFEEGNLVVEGDVIICSSASLGYGVIGRKVVAGERASINGNVVGEEVRLDAWSNIKGSVLSKSDAYIGEFTSIDGKLTVFGNLEIGRNVRIKEGFEAKGLITIQDPLPVILFVFFYLLELLRLGRLEEAEKLFGEEEFISPLIIPEGATLNLEQIKTNTDVEIVGSRVLGNIRARNISVEGSEVFGSLRGREIVVDGSRIHGAIEGRTVFIVNGSEVFGHVKADRVYMEEKCAVEGTIIGRAGVLIKPKVDVAEVLKKLRKEEPEESEESDEEKEVEKVKMETGKVKKVERVKETKETPEGDADGMEQEKVQEDVS